MTVTVLRISHFYTRYVRYSCYLFIVFALWCVVGLLGKFLCDWMLILVFRAFSGGFDCVLGVFRVYVAPLYFLWVVNLSLG